ncbi:RNA polymerase Rpc34 [Cladochytrium replicatum]|nr:RNA polymerase Rpc34 [Cladochytrium replicatum]
MFNRLAEKKMLDFVTFSDGSLGFRGRQAEEVTRIRGLDASETMIYQHIKNAGNKGLWSRDIKNRCGLHTQVVNKAIKTLETKNLIKSVKSIKNPTRKIYMLFNLEPSIELTGGAWYTDQELDVEFIRQLTTTCYKYIYAKSYPSMVNDAIFPATYSRYPTAREIQSYIKNAGITNIELSTEEIQQLLDLLEFDGYVFKLPGLPSIDDAPIENNSDLDDLVDEDDEEIIGMVGEEGGGVRKNGSSGRGEVWMYKATREFKPTGMQGSDLVMGKSAIADVPCGKCPVFHFCSEDGPVRPSTCPYLTQWLKTEW